MANRKKKKTSENILSFSAKRKQGRPRKQQPLKKEDKPKALPLASLWVVGVKLTLGGQEQVVSLFILAENVEDSIGRAYAIGRLNGWANPLVVSSVYRGIVNL